MSSPGPGPTAVGLPARVSACLFDLDGVVTDTASVHAAAWKEMFDGYLRDRAENLGEPFVPFDIATDYPAYVDGKRRQDGTRSFLASRNIELPEGAADDSEDAETINGLGTRKNNLVHVKIAKDGVTVYPGSVRYLEAAKAAGLRIAVVSSSANTQEVLRVTGLEKFFEARIDAQEAIARNLKGKPAPDTFLAGAAALGVGPDQAVVFEDAIAGVEAGRAGAFALVVGVDRVRSGDSARALRDHGADIVVTDLAELIEGRS
jgi:beta-phosphoglucomutase family hydrolase